MRTPSDESQTTEMRIELLLKDPRAIDIVKDISIDQRDRVIEKYIIIGEMVISHASIATRKETVEEFFEPLKTDINTIREQLKLIVPTIATPAKKGEITVETIFKSLQEHFLDDVFEDVSKIGKYTDIMATTSETKTPILIELKDYKGVVPTEEVEKFWRDMERRGTRYGIFVSMRSGISKCSACINVKTEINKTGIFVNNSELNWSGHLFAYYVVKKIAELESIKKKELKGKEIEKIIAKVNRHVQELQKNLDSIDTIQNIADALRTTCKNKLDELINLSTTYKRIMAEKINEIQEDIKEVELE